MWSHLFLESYLMPHTAEFEQHDLFVMVPSYGHALFVERCLRSIIGQTLTPKKLLVIDDGSKDGSPSVIERVLDDCPFDAELIVRENRGLCSTLNEGFARCDAKYFAYVGSDDVIVPTAFEQQVKLLEERPDAVLSFGHAFLIDAEDNIFDLTSNWTEFADGDLLPQLLGGQIFSTTGVVYRTSVLRKYRWNEDAILEDYELYLKLAAEGEFALNPNILGGWRQHSNNVSKDAEKMLCEWIAAQDRVASVLPFTRSELDEIQRKLRFSAASNLVRAGDRSNAFRLFRENLAGAASVSQAAGILARILTPQRIFEANRQRKMAAAIRKYGNIAAYL